MTDSTPSRPPIICDVCDKPIKNPDKNLCTLHLQGIKEALNCHPDCIRTFMKCKGDFSKLPDGRIKRAIYADIEKDAAGLLKNTGITIRDKHIHHVKEGLQVSHEEGLLRIKNLAVTFFGLPEPNEAEGEFYSVDHRLQIILMKKGVKSKKSGEKSAYDIIEVKRN